MNPPPKPILRLVGQDSEAKTISPAQAVDSFALGPWSDNADYQHQLLAECVALRAGDNITPNAHHVCCIVDMLMTLSAKTDKLTVLCEESLQKLTGMRVAQRLVKRSDTRAVNKDLQPKRNRKMDPKNLDAIKKLIGLFVDAFNDTENAFGNGQGIKNFSDYGNLLTDVMGLVGSVSSLPSEITSLSPDDAATLVSYAEQSLSIPNQKAKAIVDAILNALVSILNAVTGATGVVESVVVNQVK